MKKKYKKKKDIFYYAVKQLFIVSILQVERF